MIRLALTVALAAGLVGAAQAQSGPTLPKMPMPPSFNDPKPTDGAKPAARKPATARKASEGEGQAAVARPRRTEAAGSGSAATPERPTRYVPEEFDRGGSGDGRAKPFVSESGRPGMGMRF